MVEVTYLPLQRLHLEELIRMGKDCRGIIFKNDINVLGVAVHYTAFSDGITKLETSYMYTTQSDVTPEIEQLDDERDRRYTGLRLVVDGYTRHKNPDFAAAGRLLLKNLNQHGGPDLTTTNYGAQTTRIDSIVQDWETKPNLKDAVELLPGVKEFFVELKEDNNAFQTKYMERVEELRERGTLPPPSKLRSDVEKKWERLRKRLDAQAEVNDYGEPWAKTIHELNVLIARWKTILARRASGGQDEQDGTDEQ